MSARKCAMGWGALCASMWITACAFNIIGIPPLGVVPLQLKNPVPPLLGIKTSSWGSINTASIMNTVRVQL